jgi:hypothetical protein
MRSMSFLSLEREPLPATEIHWSDLLNVSSTSSCLPTCSHLLVSFAVMKKILPSSLRATGAIGRATNLSEALSEDAERGRDQTISLCALLKQSQHSRSMTARGRLLKSSGSAAMLLM